MNESEQVRKYLEGALTSLQNAIDHAEQIEVGGPQLAERLREIRYSLQSKLDAL